jgi:hypothetical protein
MRMFVVRALLLIATLILYPLLGSASAQQTDNSQADIPPGTKITMQNWQQYKQFMPDGMVALFEGKYFWKIPADLEMDIGPTVTRPLPSGYACNTQKVTLFNILKMTHPPARLVSSV